MGVRALTDEPPGLSAELEAVRGQPHTTILVSGRDHAHRPALADRVGARPIIHRLSRYLQLDLPRENAPTSVARLSANRRPVSSADVRQAARALRTWTDQHGALSFVELDGVLEALAGLRPLHVLQLVHDLVPTGTVTIVNIGMHRILRFLDRADPATSVVLEQVVILLNGQQDPYLTTGNFQQWSSTVNRIVVVDSDGVRGEILVEDRAVSTVPRSEPTPARPSEPSFTWEPRHGTRLGQGAQADRAHRGHLKIWSRLARDTTEPMAGNGRGLPKSTGSPTPVGLPSWFERTRADVATADVTGTGGRRAVVSRVCVAGTEIDSPLAEPLDVERRYDLLISVGSAHPRSLLPGDAHFPDQFLPHMGNWLTVVAHVEGEPYPLGASLFLPADGNAFSCDCAVGGGEHTCTPDRRQPWARLALPTFAGRKRMVATVCLYYQAMVIHAHEIVLPTTVAGPTGRVIYELSQTFRRIERFANRTLSLLAVDRSDGQQVYVNAVTTDTMRCEVSSDKVQTIRGQAEESLLRAHFGATYNPLELRSVYDGHQRKDRASYVEDLRELAKVGRLLRQAVFGANNVPAELLRHEAAARGKPATVQIARPAENSVMPWQLLYDFPVLSDEMRSEWFDCLAVTDPPLDPPPPRCPHEMTHPTDGRNVLCPYGFWGLAHLLEIPPSNAEMPSVVGMPGSGRPRTLAGFNTKLSSIESRRHLTELGRLLDVIEPVVEDPHVLGRRAGDRQFEVLYLYCHGSRTARRGALGTDQVLVLGSEGRGFTPNDVLEWPESFQWPSCSLTAPQPLVFLNACHTAEWRLGTLTMFAEAFTRSLRAGGVITTEVSALQELVGLVAELLFSRLVRGEPIGGAMRSMRWDLLRLGNVMGLAYVLHGAANLALRQPSTA